MIAEESEAIDHALNAAEEGDLLVITADDLARSWISQIINLNSDKVKKGNHSGHQGVRARAGQTFRARPRTRNSSSTSAACAWRATTKIRTIFQRRRSRDGHSAARLEAPGDRQLPPADRAVAGVPPDPGAILDVRVAILASISMRCWPAGIATSTCWQGSAGPSVELTHRRFENGFNQCSRHPSTSFTAPPACWRPRGISASANACYAQKIAEVLIEGIVDEMSVSKRTSALIVLQSAAAEHGVDFLADDDTVSVGHGCCSQSFEMDELPGSEQIDWAAKHDIPVALVTGTNGKSTSVRLLDAIARADGKVSGITSTDFVRVGDDIIDHGDCSGRQRAPDARSGFEVAFLEVARERILRRDHVGEGAPRQRW